MSKRSTIQPTETVAKPVRTTTLDITPPATYELLAQKFQLIRYELQRGHSADNSKRNRDEDYVTIHNAIRESMDDAPYKLFTHDRLGGDGKERWAVYTLMQTNDKALKPPTLVLDGSTIQGKAVEFDAIKYHTLIKLLQVTYFQSVRNAERFIGQDKCYIQVKRENDEETKYICLEMEITGVPHENYRFYIDEHARRFIRVSLEDKERQYSGRHTYFQQVPLNTTSNKKMIFRQLKKGQLEDHKQSLFRIARFKKTRPSLDYHATNDSMDETRGYHLYQFIYGFSNYLAQFGFTVVPVWRDFYPFNDKEAEKFELPIRELNPIYVLDVRHAKDKIALQPFLEVYRQIAPQGMNFVCVQDISAIPNAQKYPVLIMQDGEKKAYAKDNPLYGDSDPYREIYSSYPEIAKQFVNVNDNSFFEWVVDVNDPTKKKQQIRSRESYLTYNALSAPKNGDSDKVWKNACNKAQVVLNQLLLKHLIMNHGAVAKVLPLLPDHWLFVHKESREFGKQKVEFRVAIRVEKGVLQFFDLTDSSEGGDRDRFVTAQPRIDLPPT